jgi:hypothetical protein
MDKKIPPQKEAALNEINEQYKGSSSKEQCARFLAALSLFKINSFEASRYLSIYHPPARVLQLRQDGHHIDTVWESVIDEKGGAHRVGCYVLRATTGNGDLGSAYLRGQANATTSDNGKTCEVTG